MTPHLPRAATLFAALTFVLSASAQPPLPPPRPVPDTPDVKKDKLDEPEPGIKLADKGPIHEAFAQPGADVRGKGIVAPKAPPPPIPEEPPETKPDGENVKWVAGYWQWDAEKEDHIWISGFWRNIPAGRDWQAGKWTEKGGQWHYAPGFWRPTAMNSWRIDLPEPPKSVESGPSTPPENPDAVWIPGTWEYRNEKFVWRAGYWAHPNGNQLWQPGQYVETGSGFAYVPGFWDYPLEERGLLYAPVYFDQPLWQTPGWCFRPRFALGFGGGWGWGNGAAFGSLFIGPGFNNFCYGNFWNPWTFGFGNSFWGGGFGIGFGFGNSFCGWGGCQPWWCQPKGFCNPLWNHYCWLNKNNPNWAANVKTTSVARAVGAAPRPLAVAPPNGGGQRPLAVGAPGLGGLAQSAVRTATATTKQQPLIQPANSLVRSQANAKGNANSAALGSGSPRLPAAGSGVDIRSGANAKAPTAANAPGAGRAIPTTPPIHSGAVQITPGSVSNSTATPGSGQSTVRSAGAIQQAPPNTPQIVPGRPDRPGVSGDFRPVTQVPTNQGPATIRSGSQPNLPSVGSGTTIRPAPANPAPVIRSAPAMPSSPSIGSGAPRVPSAPSIGSGAPRLPSAPVIRSAPANIGGGRSMPINPGGGGPRIPSGGGGRPGGKR